MNVHLIGVCGTGMGAFASLLVEAGHSVSGSDTRFDAPIGPLLERLGVTCFKGWRAEHIGDDLDWVVVGNVCRSDNPEAQAAIERVPKTTSLPEALRELFLANRTPQIVCGTHGKTTTTALTHHLLSSAGKQPGLFVGGIPVATGRTSAVGAPNAPFVLEGDEYDSAFFDKTPKFWKYAPTNAILTSIEHDHIDIYPNRATYVQAFIEFVSLLPKDGWLFAWAGDETVRRVARQASCNVRFYALDGDDCGDEVPVWLGAPAPQGRFDLFIGGSFGGRIPTTMVGHHNLRNAVAAIALCTEGVGCSLDTIARAVPKFRGVLRRQQHLGAPRGIDIFDDFAHHPTAVTATLEGFRQRFGGRRIVAVFEPRSATASTDLHQARYPNALAQADVAFVAPVARSEVATDHRLDVHAVVEDLRQLGTEAFTPPDLAALVKAVCDVVYEGDVVVCMSNGSFGNVPQRIVQTLDA